MVERANVLRPSGITVVIPTLDRLDLVQRACNSVQCRQSQRVEIIVIDDGSAQDLRRMLPPQNAHGIELRCLRFQRNRGPQAARNLGIRRARFSHIAFLDSDDAFSPDKLDRVLNELDRAGSRIDLLFHGVKGMPKYGHLGRFWQRWLRGWLPFAWWVALLNPVVTPALVIRRARRLGVPRLRHCEDWAFLLRYVQPDTQVLYLDEELASVYRPPGTEGGLSAAVWKMRTGEFVARRVLLRKPGVSALLRYAIGAGAGAARICNDLLRGRYRSHRSAC